MTRFKRIATDQTIKIRIEGLPDHTSDNRDPWDEIAQGNIEEHNCLHARCYSPVNASLHWFVQHTSSIEIFQGLLVAVPGAVRIHRNSNCCVSRSLRVARVIVVHDQVAGELVAETAVFYIVLGDALIYPALPPSGVALVCVAARATAFPFTDVPDAVTAVSSTYC